MAEIQEKTQQDFSILKLTTTIFKEVGIAGFICIVLTFIFIYYSSIEQKTEFIDKFFLFKNSELTSPNVIFVIGILIITIIISNAYLLKENKRISKELDRVSALRTDLQEKLINKGLQSSN